MIRLADDLPRVLVMVDARRPRERLVADANVAPGSVLRQLVQLRGGPRIVVDRVRRNAGTHEHHRRSERVHDVELALGAIEIAPELLVGHAFDLAERLVESMPVRDPRPCSEDRSATPEVDQVVFEDLDRVEARSRDRIEPGEVPDRQTVAMHLRMGYRVVCVRLEINATAELRGHADRRLHDGQPRGPTLGGQIPVATASPRMRVRSPRSAYGQTCNIRGVAPSSA